VLDQEGHEAGVSLIRPAAMRATRQVPHWRACGQWPRLAAGSDPLEEST
jgi:hypothetical protein